MDVPQVRYADAGDGWIAYQTFGEGPPDLVVTPGFVSHLDLQWTMPSYFRFFEMVASFARVIVFEKRGTGLSDPTLTAIVLDQRADEELIIDLREPKELTAADHMWLFLARRSPLALRALAGLAARAG